MRQALQHWAEQVLVPWLAVAYPWLVTAGVFLLVLWLSNIPARDKPDKDSK